MSVSAVTVEPDRESTPVGQYAAAAKLKERSDVHLRQFTSQEFLVLRAKTEPHEEALFITWKAGNEFLTFQDRDLEVLPRGSPAYTERGMNLMVAWTASKLLAPLCVSMELSEIVMHILMVVTILCFSQTRFL